MLNAVPQGTVLYNKGKDKKIDFGSKTSKSYHFKGPDFQKNPKDKRIKNYKIFVWKINSSTSILYSKKSNPKQKSFWYFFISKKGTFSPKKIFAQLSLLKIIDVFDQSAAFPFKMSKFF